LYDVVYALGHRTSSGAGGTVVVVLDVLAVVDVVELVAAGGVVVVVLIQYHQLHRCRWPGAADAAVTPARTTTDATSSDTKPTVRRRIQHNSFAR
jgi:hypothetical protein